MSAIDYRIVDVHTDPPRMTDSFWTEQLIRLPRTFACYRPPDGAPDPGPPPAESKGYATFATFAMLSKLNETLVATWSEILRRAPGSRLLMASGGLHESSIRHRIHQAFAAHGIPSDRLELRGQLALTEYLALHRQVDVLLDSHPVNGHTVTCHALWMGVPVVSLAGRTYRGRLGASVLRNAGLPELVADTPSEYIRIATTLTGDLPRLRSLRRNLRQRLRGSPLCDSRQFAREIEAAFRSVWTIRCSKP